MAEALIKKAYSVLAGEVTEHSCVVVTNPSGIPDWVVTCSKTGHSLKFPGTLTEAELEAQLAQLQKHNEGQVVAGEEPAAPAETIEEAHE